MAAKKPPPVLEVVFQGKDIRPELISISTLSRALGAIHKLVANQEVTEEDEEQQDFGPLQLVSVRRGSAAYGLAGQTPGIAIGRLRIVGQVLEHPEDVGKSDFVLTPIEALSSISRKLDTTIVIKEPGRDSPILIKIGPDSYRSISSSLLISGDTSISGEVKGVGGATEMRCRLRVPFQEKLLYCKVADAEVARKLGDCLYRDVVVRGTAYWYKNTWKMMTMTITSSDKTRIFHITS